MELTGIKQLRQVSGYTDLRSIRKWVRELGLELFRIGKNYAVNKNEFESALNNRYKKENVTEQRNSHAYIPKSKHEKEFLNDLTETLTKL